MTNSLIRLERVSRRFGALDVLLGLSLEIARGEFVAVVGPSGCGKTTLLNLLSGYDSPSEGRVERSGTMRMVYQQDGLFPWKTAGQNILMGLRQIPGDSNRRSRLHEMLELIGLQGFADHYPHQLSEGMKQRVELARALVGDADLLLMDEPFSSLDYLTRLHMRGELANMLEKRPRTVVLVTHDIEEAAQLADRVVVLSERPGQIRCELRLSLARPRDLTHPQVVRAVHLLLSKLGLERNGAETGPPARASASAASAGAERL